MQFPGLNGLRSTLLQMKQQSLSDSKQVVQIVYLFGDHSVNSQCCGWWGKHLYDSVYQTLDKDTTQVIHTLLLTTTHPLQLQMVQMQKQQGGADSGLFAIATITAITILALLATYDQAAMSQHLVKCFEQHTLKPFPTKWTIILNDTITLSSINYMVLIKVTFKYDMG